VKPPPFGYVAATSVEEALDALAEHGDEAKLLAGGQSLVPLLAKKKENKKKRCKRNPTGTRVRKRRR